MDITGNDKKPFYTVYYFGDIYELDGWEGDSDYSSFNDVNISWNEERQVWRAVFKTVRVKGDGETSFHDIWWMERSNPEENILSRIIAKVRKKFQ